MDGTYSIVLGDRGRLVLPAELRARQHWDQGTPLVVIETPAGVVLLSREQAKAAVRRQLAGESLADELLAERRRTAAAEDA